VSGYAARLRLLKQLLRDDPDLVRVGADSHGAATAVFAGAVRVVFSADQVEVRVPPGGCPSPTVMDLAGHLAGLAELPLVNHDPEVDFAAPSPSPF